MIQDYKIEVYTDGACFPNPGKGGAGVVIVAVAYDGTVLKKRSLSVPLGENVTNNAAEVSAVIEAMKAFKQAKQTFTVYSDSQYVVNIGNGLWVASSNKELWHELFQTMAVSGHAVKFQWIRGHDGNRYNEEAHYLANKALTQE